MSIVARGLALEPTALVGPSVYGYTRKPVVPPPVTQPIDPYAKKANTQVIRESHLKKYLERQKRKVIRPLEPVSMGGLLPAIRMGLSAADAIHIEMAATLIAHIAAEPGYRLTHADIALLEGTPEVLKRITRH